MPPRRDKSSDLLARAAFYAGLGFLIPASAVGGYFLGRFLDLHLHTGSLLAMIGAFAGTAAGIVEVIQLVMRMERNAKDSEDGGN